MASLKTVSILGIDPQIESRDDVAAALRELSLLQCLEERARSDFNRKVSAMLQQVEKTLVIEFDADTDQPQTVGFRERAELLKARIAAFADEHRDELLTEGKSIEFASGTLAWRALPDAISPVEDPKQVIEKIDKETKCMEWLLNKLTTVCLKIGPNLGTFLKVGLQLNLTGIKQAYAEKKITAKGLQKYGLRVETNRESFSIDLKRFELDGASDSP